MPHDDVTITLPAIRFEAAWRAGLQPRVEDFLPLDSAPIDDRVRREILVELIRIDLQHRWSPRPAGSETVTAEGDTIAQSVSRVYLEEYLTRFPQLLAEERWPIALICEEYRIRHRWGDKPGHRAYAQRFPQWSSELLHRLPAVDAELIDEPTAERTMDAGRRGTDCDTQSGRTFGDYELIAEIARGGMGVVYKARQLRLNRAVALKMIKAGELASDAEVRRFQREATAAARLDHPAIVPVFEVGELNGQHFYSMGFVEGRSLQQRLVEGPLAPRQAAALLRIVADAMQYSHSQGVIHRDLKPANVLLVETPGSAGSTGTGSGRKASPSGAPKAVPTVDEPLPFFPRVTDFGLAKQSEADAELTSTGQILGTPSYMPPEQARGESTIGAAADIYSLGAILYATLTGRPPFQAANPMETVRQVIDQDPVPPRRLNPSIDRDIETICLKCLQKSPGQRYATADELAADLQRYLHCEPIQARPIGNVLRLWRWCRRKPALAGLLVAGAAVFLAGIALVVVALQLSAARDREQAAQERQKADQLRLAAVEESAKAQSLLLKATQQVADTQRYYALLNGARKRIGDSKTGWTSSSMEDIRQAACLRAIADRAELRHVAARCLTGVDLRRIKSAAIMPGYRSHLMAFDPTGTRVAAATLKHAALQLVAVYAVPSGDLIHTLTVGSDVRWQFLNRNQDGIDQIAFVAGGKALAIASRSGWVYRWDLTTATPTRSDHRIPVDEARHGPPQAPACTFPQPVICWPPPPTTRRS